MNELARYKEQYDEKLVRRLTDQIDSLGLDITMLNMKNNDLQEEVAYLRKTNLKIKTDWELKRVEEVDDQINTLIEQVRTFKNQADDYKSKYLDAIRQARDVQIDYEARIRSGTGFESELQNMRKVHQST